MNMFLTKGGNESLMASGVFLFSPCTLKKYGILYVYQLECCAMQFLFVPSLLKSHFVSSVWPRIPFTLDTFLWTPPPLTKKKKVLCGKL
jgi:hypothetical protein